MSQSAPQYPNVCAIDTGINSDDLVQSKAICIHNDYKIETRVLPKDFQFDDKNLQSLLKKTDIVTDKYEGGLKIWECSIDLSKCIMNSFTDTENVKHFIQSIRSYNTIDVLELGCGHSLPSITFVSIIHSFIQNTKHVQDNDDNESKQQADDPFKIMLCLQDLNKSVLHHVSIPNTWLNCKTWINSEHCEAFHAISGDWRDIQLIQNLLKITQNKEEEPRKYDVIFGSETIYNESMIETLLNLLTHLLANPNGICFIAAKSYYFGIGGGTQSLKLFMKNNEKCPFDVHTIQRIDDGMSNLRETIVLSWKGSCEWDLSSIWKNMNEFESEEEEEAEEEEEYQNDED